MGGSAVFWILLPLSSHWNAIIWQECVHRAYFREPSFQMYFQSKSRLAIGHAWISPNATWLEDTRERRGLLLHCIRCSAGLLFADIVTSVSEVHWHCHCQGPWGSDERAFDFVAELYTTLNSNCFFSFPRFYRAFTSYSKQPSYIYVFCKVNLCLSDPCKYYPIDHSLLALITRNKNLEWGASGPPRTH